MSGLVRVRSVDMPGIKDLSIVNSNTATATPVESGTEVTLCSPELCGSKNLTVYKRTISHGKMFDLQAGNNYHLVYVMNPARGSIRYKNETHEAEEGAGVLLNPSDSAQFDASGSKIELLHMV